MLPSPPVRENSNGGSSRTTLAVALVLILVLPIFLIAFFHLGPLGGYRDGVIEQDMGIIINRPTTWSQMDINLEEHVEIAHGGSLTILECNVTVMLEDMLFRNAGLDVREGGPLLIERSTVTLVADPRVNGSIALWGRLSPSYYDSGTTSISRAVNLGNATRPALDLDVCWKADTRLVVTAQPSPQAPLEQVAVLESPDVGPSAWRHHSVDLSAYRGTVVRLAIFHETRMERYVLVSDPRVLDGGGPLLGDRFDPSLWAEGTSGGSFSYNGWVAVGSDAGWAVLEMAKTYVGPLLTSSSRWSDSTVELVDTRVVATGIVPRRANVYGTFTKGPFSSTSEGGMSAANFLSAVDGGGIDIYSGRLVVRDCTLENVPLASGANEVELRNSTFKGSTDIVTIAGDDVTVEACDFTFEPCPEATRTALFGLPVYERPLWSLSIDGYRSEGTISVTDCTFEGGEIALDLNYANLGLTGCEFKGVQGLAVWDHESLPGWDQVAACNTFEDCLGDLYLRTVKVDLAVTCWDRGYSWSHDDRFPNLASEVLEEPPACDVRVTGWLNGNRLFVCIPLQLVQKGGTVSEPDDVAFRLPLGYGTYKTIGLRVTERSRTVELLPNELPPTRMLLLTHAAPAGDPRPVGTSGSVELSFMFDQRGVFDPGPRLIFALDGVDDRWVDAKTSGEQATIPDPEAYGGTYPYGRLIRKTIYIPEGEHSVQVRYVEFDDKANRYVEGMNNTYHFFRVVSGGDPEAMAAFLEEHEDGWLMVDTGLVLQPGDGLPAFALQHPSFNLLLPEGSRVVLGSHPGMGQSLDVMAVGSGTLEVRDQRLRSLEVHRSGGLLELENVSAADTTLALDGCRCDARDLDCSPRSLRLSQAATMVVEGSTFDVDDLVRLELEGSHLRMSNVTFSTVPGRPAGGTVDVDIRNRSSLVVEDSDFSRCSLAILHDGEVDWTLEVSGCTFANPAVLSVDEAYAWGRYGNYKIPGNVTGSLDNDTFAGPGAALVLMTMHAGLLGDGNAFERGATAFAHYRPNVAINEDSGFQCSYDFVDDGTGVTRNLLSGRIAGESWDVFVDLGGRPADIHAPRQVTLMVISGEGARGAWWFAPVDPTGAVVQLRSPTWGGLDLSPWRA